MRYKELTDEDLLLLKEFYHSPISHKEKVDYLSDRYGVDERTIRRWWQERMGLTSMITESPQLVKARERYIDAKADVVIVVTAQEKTPVHKDFLSNILAYKSYLETKKGKTVEIVAIPLHYRNPTSIAESQNSLSWWDKKVEDYLFYGRLTFYDTVIWADNRLNPTVQNPLSGREGFASTNHLILGHPRIHFLPLPRFNGKPFRVMATTGALTHRHYSKSSVGDKALLHHSYGFVILEKKDEYSCYIPRNVKAKDDGSFIDIKYKVKGGEVHIIDMCEGIMIGDLHYRDIDKGKMDATYALIKQVKPKRVIFQDVIDGSTFNHHEQHDLYRQKRRIRQGKYEIDVEVQEVLEFLKHFAKNFKGDVYVLQSNHDEFLEKHINGINWKHDLHNSEAYLKYALLQQTADLDEHGTIIGYLINDLGIPNLKYIKESDSLNINGYEQVHGHLGANGARGNPQTFRRLNHKTMSGHSHCPIILDGSTVVGTSSKLNLPYVKGLSSWMHADSLIFETKNQLICYDYDYKISSLI